MAQEAMYITLKSLSQDITGDAIDAARVEDWLFVYGTTKRLMFLHDNDLDFVGENGLVQSPLGMRGVLNDDRNDWLRACKKSYFGSAWFRRKPLKEQETLKEIIGEPMGDANGQ